MDGIRIVQARVRGESLPPDLEARLARRIDAAIQQLDPGEAILCLRHAGGRLTADALEAPMHRPSADWQQIIDQARKRLAAARRPWVEHVTPDAEAVRFADTAEWLACAARDLLRGRLDAWWWRGLPAAGADGVLAAWLAHPDSVPAALERLAEQGHALAFAQCCAPQAVALRQALLQRYAIADVARPAASPAALAVIEALADCPAPALCALAPAASAWLWLALGLARVPAAVSAAPQAPEAWIRLAAPDHAPAEVIEPLAMPEQGDVAPAQPPEAQRDLPAAPRAEAVAANPVPANPTPGTQALPSAGAPQLPNAVSGEAPRASLRWHIARAPEADLAEQPALDELPPGLPLGANLDLPAPVFPAPRVLAEPPSALLPANIPFVAPPPATLETACGGVFHLLNLALALGLYPDFTRPAERGLPLHPWDLLSLLAHDLLGEAFDADPLAQWLAQSAGRPPGVAAGAWAEPPPADWSLPQDWLLPWAATRQPWRQICTDGRTALWHPAGFCVADQPSEQCLDGADWPGWIPPRRIALRGRPKPREVTHWAMWAARLAPFIRARLAAATGLEAGQVADLLRCPARLLRMGDALEVRIALAALPIELRLAGLDRDLGWLPAAGCALRYRFDAGGDR